MILVLNIVGRDKMLNGAFCCVEPLLVRGEGVEPAQCKGRLAVVINGAELLFFDKLAVQNVIVFAAVLIEHGEYAVAELYGKVLVFDRIHVLGQRNDGNAAAAELDLVRFLLVQIRYLVVSLDYCVFNHVIYSSVDNGNKLFVAGHPVLANKAPKRARVADNVVIINILIESRIVAVNKASVVLDLVNKEARGVLDKLGGVLLVHGVDLAPAVIVNVAYEIVNLVVFIAHPADAFENNIAVRQGGEGAASGFFQVCVQITFVNTLVFVVEYLGTVKLSFQKCRFKVLVKGYAVSEKFGSVVVRSAMRLCGQRPFR